MRVTFLAPSASFPIGGVMFIWKFAEGLARRGHDVTVAHIEFLGERLRSLDGIDFFDFDPAVEHIFPDRVAAEELPAADVVFCVDERIPERAAGLPAMWVQAVSILEPEVEARIFGSACPKVCTSTFLRQHLLESGVPGNELIHVPYGLDHDKYRVKVPIDERPRRVAVLYHEHPMKGPTHGVQVMEKVMAVRPDIEVVAFGTGQLLHDQHPDWFRFRHSPPQDEIVDDIYNGSSIFLLPSQIEGFGMAGIEAMACGCALACFHNGGSADYAIKGETAVMAKPLNRQGLADGIVRYLDDDRFRRNTAERGRRLVERFQWPRSAELLEAFLLDYVDDPARFGARP